MHAPASAPLLSIAHEDGGVSHEILAGSLAGGPLVIADHASNAMPEAYDRLGMPPEELERHIAYDIGVATMARSLATALGCPAVLSRFSRLLIDPNRGDDDPTRVMRLSDGAVVPGNARIAREEVADRMARFSLPYHDAIGGLIDRALGSGVVPVVISLHSFTPRMKGRERPWHVGVLWDSDQRLAQPLLDRLRQEPDLVVGDNEPYDGALAGDTMGRHCIPRGIPHVLIEVRQDLIGTDKDAHGWGLRLAMLLSPLLAAPALRRLQCFGSRATGA